LISETGGIVQEIKAAINDKLGKGKLCYYLMQNRKITEESAETKLKTQLAIIESQYVNLGSVKVKLEDAKNKYDRSQRLFSGRRGYPASIGGQQV